MKILISTLFVLLSLSVYSQQYLTAYKTDDQKISANITLHDGYTLYGLSRTMGVEVADIVTKNPSIDINNMELKTTLALPINPEVIQDSPDGLANPITVKYYVSPKETLFSIARVYAAKEVAVIKSINNKTNNALSIGEELTLGWIDWPYVNVNTPLLGSVELAPEDVPVIDNTAEYIGEDTSYVVPNPEWIVDIRDTIAQDSVITSTLRGIALMEKRGAGSKDLLVIHKDAQVDSEIQLYNPMMRRHVKAKVVAQIPKNSYPDDVSVVISPAVASALGALDRRIKLNRTVKDIPALVLGKVESFNPGNSIKDRMALKMVEDAEKAGNIQPGGTFIECTSGNTGMGIALACAVKGYKCIFTTSDKQSKEKIDILKAVGAEVIVCPTDVRPDDPRSYYSVAEKLSKEIPNSVWLNQYDNPSNAIAHYESTGPELWEQTDGKITHLVVGVGTGGTISGTAKYLKEKNPDIKIWGIDTYGSVFKKYHETKEFDEKEIYPYITEGIGEDILPENVDFDIIDFFEKVTDKDGAVMTRRMAREEGLFCGYSCGSALAGLIQLKDKLTKDDVVVVIFHDHGSRYVGKIYNDEWMHERGFLDRDLKIKDLIANKSGNKFHSVDQGETVRKALTLMKDNDISQMPVTHGDNIVGSITESRVLNYILENPLANTEKTIESIMGPAFPEVSDDIALKDLNRYITKEMPAVLAKDMSGDSHVITQYDIIQAI